MAHLRLVIFDLDGVIVDTERIVYCKMSSMLGVEGFHIDTLAAYQRFLGRSYEEIAHIVLMESGVEIGDRFFSELNSTVRADAEWTELIIDGFYEFVDKISIRPRCILSAAPIDRLNDCVLALNLAEIMNGGIFDRTKFHEGKSKPEPFLLSAYENGVSPCNCVVIEDNPTAIKAAKKAGMTVIGFSGGEFCGSNHRKKLHAAGADQVVCSYRELALQTIFL